MPEKVEDKIKKLKEENECCPACTNIEKCRAYNENGEGRFPKTYKWSESCCEKCNDTTCFQNPFYIMMLLQKNKLNKDDFVGYHEEALHTILSS
jgi:hypothetical protein